MTIPVWRAEVRANAKSGVFVRLSEGLASGRVPGAGTVSAPPDKEAAFLTRTAAAQTATPANIMYRIRFFMRHPFLIYC
jgi:hypothetical protein